MHASRREFMGAATATALAAVSSSSWAEDSAKGKVRTVLGPLAPKELGATLMHEHAPTVDWSELYATRAAPLGNRREEMLTDSTQRLNAFCGSLGDDFPGPGAIVEVTPIRVGRYPRLLVELARRTRVRIIAATGFWCEALAPQHPWAVRLGVREGGVAAMAKLFIREITQGMEDPTAPWGERYTDIQAGIIKIGTSTHLRPSERAVHQAAALAQKETGCPITTHTTDGGGLEQAQFLLDEGADPAKLIIGHQGYRDDRENEQANQYHELIARLGCYLQFDRVGHAKYPVESQAAQIAHLIRSGHGNRVLVSHDNVPYVYPEFTAPKKSAEAWKAQAPDYTIVPRRLAPALARLGVTKAQIRALLVENPQRVLAF